MSEDNTLELTIQHFIYLTKEERYKLQERSGVHTIGVSIPVWSHEGSSSEPAKEVFCRYFIKNLQRDDVAIKIVKDGYIITLPYQIEDDVDFSAKCLLDYKEGGCEGMFYQENTNVSNKDSNQTTAINHYIQIRDINALKKSIVT